MAKLHRKSKHVVEINDALLTASEKEAARLDFVVNRAWFVLFWWIIVAGLVALAVRAIDLAVVEGETYRRAAEGNSVKTVQLLAPRGKIYDHLGAELVTNVPTVDVVMMPHELPSDPAQQAEVIRRAAALLRIDTGHITALLTSFENVPTEPVLLKENVSQEDALLILGKAQELPGIVLEKAAKRNYADSAIFSHVIGYDGRVRKEDLEEHPDYLYSDRIGRDGVEKEYEKALHGVHGAQHTVVDSRGTVIKEVGITLPQAGSDLFLTIDAGLQKKIFDSLSAMMERAQTTTAAAIALNPKNGEVLALVSLPSFDNNSFAHGITADEYAAILNDPAKPLFNRAIAGAYAPGSTIKPLIAAAALSEHVITPETQIESRGGIQVGNFFFGDWRTHGFTDLRRAIAVSSDVYFYTLGGGYGGIQGLGMTRMKKYETLFGFGAPSGIDLPGEASGFVPDEEWKEKTLGERWYVGNSYHAAIGQGFVTTTPLQIVNYVAAIANGGTLYQPHVLSSVRGADGSFTTTEQKIIRRDFVDPNILRVVREGMRQTITDGTATMLQNLSVAVAGKTGTAQFGTEGRTHSWFVSFAPYDDPQIALVVLVEGQTDEISSSTVPVTKDVYEWYFDPEKK